MRSTSEGERDRKKSAEADREGDARGESARDKVRSGTDLWMTLMR